jgi:hypothetical protein
VIKSEKDLTLWIYRNLKGNQCPICDKWFEPNGTGPEVKPFKKCVTATGLLKRFIRFILALMPWDKILNKIAVPVHDWRCHIGKHEYNLSFDRVTNEFKDHVELGIYEWCQGVPFGMWLYRRCMNRIDEIYAFAVGKTSFGKEAYDANSCAIK